jgi:hypothetical protein
MWGNVARRSILIRLLAVIAIIALLFPGYAKASPDCACFTLPDRASHTISGVVNTYYPGNSSVSSGSTQISIGLGRGAVVDIKTGDLLLVIQMQDAKINYSNNSAYGKGGTSTSGTGYRLVNNTGKYEFIIAMNNISFAAGGLLKIDGYGSYGGLMNSYTNADASTTNGQRRFQVIHVPAYMNARLGGTLTALPWDGRTGGVLSIDVVSSLNLNGHNIDVTGMGFRGGGGRTLTGTSDPISETDYVTQSTTNANGSKGEGIAGTPKWVFYAGVVTDTQPTSGTDGYPGGSYARGGPGTGGGGGTDGNPVKNEKNSGGGGGSNGGAGGKGGFTWSAGSDRGGLGGIDFVESSAGRVVMGGGGGAGSTNEGTGSPAYGWASSGAAGGGAVLMRIGHITGSGVIRANGADGLTTLNDGAGGGGGGGSVLLLAKDNPLTGLSVTAKGGKGGDAWPLDAGGAPDRYGPGGGGGGGTVFLSGSANTIDVSGGLNGITTTLMDAYGAVPGGNGKTVTTMTSDNVPGAKPGYMCYEPTAINLSSLKASSKTGSKAAMPFAAVLVGAFLASLSMRKTRI